MRRARVLIVDDEAASRMVASSALAGLELDIVECASAAAALEAVAEPTDAIILDVMMPEMNGEQLCRILRSTPTGRDVPILMLTALTERSHKLSALAAGADDFLVKPLDRLELRTRIATICRLNRAQRMFEERQRLDSLVALSPHGVLVVNGETGCVCFANARAEQLLGGPLVGKWLDALLGDDSADRADRLLGLSAVPEQQPASEPWTVHRNGRILEVSAGAIEWTGTPAVQLVVNDVTMTRMFAEEVHRLERMESTARLSASIAHDFATVMQVCMVHLHTLADPMPSDDTGLALREMQHAVRRGAQITRELLGFSRRGLVRPGGTCDAAAVTRDVGRLLQSLLPATTQVSIDVPDTPCPIGIADFQFEQVLINLATNARDAMAGVGDLRITLRPAPDDPLFVEVLVADTGTGIDPRMLERLGEPFASTKPEGQGTGLGLWSVHRMIEGAQGRWSFETAVGEGTTVHLFLPIPDHPD